jgi:hypothetical protein
MADLPPVTAQRVYESEAVPRPEMIFDFEFEDGVLFISLRNIGGRPAHDVRTNVEPRISGLGGRMVLSDLPVLREIPFFAPGKCIRFLFDSSASYFARGEPSRISARITWSDQEGNEYAAVIRHDLEIYRTLTWRVR